MAELAPLSQLLAEAKIRDITSAQQDIVSLQHNNTVGEALRQLAAARILSAPVVVSSGLEDFENGGLPPGDAAPSLLGWLDVSDMVKAFLDHLHEKKLVLPKSMLQLMALLEKEGPDFADKMLVTIVGGEDRGLMYQADAGTSVLAAIQGFFLGGPAAPKPAPAGPEPMEATGAGAAGGDAVAAAAAPAPGRRVVHRLAVFNSLGEITHIVSQTDVMRYLLKRRDAFGPVGSRPINDLGLLEGKGPLVVLQPHTPTLLAFEQLAAAGVTGAPVIASDGELIANLSVSDIRCIEPAHFGILALPLAEFLALSHGTSYLGYSARSSKGAFHPFFAGGAPPPPSPGASPRLPLGRAGSGAFGCGGSPRAAAAPPAGAGGAAAAAAAARRRAPPGSPAGGSGGGAAGAMLPPGCRNPTDPDAADEEQQARRDGGGSGGGAAGDVSVPLITCAPDSALVDVMRLMVENDVHRVYVYVPDAKPAVVGVVTPTDILRLLLRLGLGGAGAADGAGAAGGDAGVEALVAAGGALARPAGAGAQQQKKARVGE